MTLIRYTYPRDVARFGEWPREVPEGVARRLILDRRAELVAPAPVVDVEAEDPDPEP